MTMLVNRSDARRLGLKYYFTGKPCKYGHVSKRNTKFGRCTVCETFNARNFRAKNSKRINARLKELRHADPERVRLIKEKFYLKHPGIRTIYHKRWRAKHPENTLASVHRRRRRLMVSGEHHTGDDVREIKALQKNKCAICRTKLVSHHVDHIVPLTRGGHNGRKNIQLLCPTCNIKKANYDPVDFMQSQGRLL